MVELPNCRDLSLGRECGGAKSLPESTRAARSYLAALGPALSAVRPRNEKQFLRRFFY